MRIEWPLNVGTPHDPYCVCSELVTPDFGFFIHSLFLYTIRLRLFKTNAELKGLALHTVVRKGVEQQRESILKLCKTVSA
jgi:hypothetical protein